MARNTSRYAVLAVSASAVLVAALVVANQAPAQSPPAAGANNDVVVKGAVDHYDGEDHSLKPETPAQVEVKKKYSPYAGRKYPPRVFLVAQTPATEPGFDSFDFIQPSISPSRLACSVPSAGPWLPM